MIFFVVTSVLVLAGVSAVVRDWIEESFGWQKSPSITEVSVKHLGMYYF